MKSIVWVSALVVLTASFGWASENAGVLSGTAAARQMMGTMRFAADEAAPAPTVEAPAAVPAVPDAEPVPVPEQTDEIAHLTYDAEPGLSLYRNIKAMDDLAQRPCSGGSCLGLWGIQESFSANFTAGYKATIPLLYSADKMLGDAAHDFAAHFCGHSFTTGDENAASTLYRMLYTSNEAMGYIKVIQSNAGRKGADLTTCVPSELTVNGKSEKIPPPEPPARPKPSKKPKK